MADTKYELTRYEKWTAKLKPGYDHMLVGNEDKIDFEKEMFQCIDKLLHEDPPSGAPDRISVAIAELDRIVSKVDRRQNLIRGFLVLAYAPAWSEILSKLTRDRLIDFIEAAREGIHDRELREAFVRNLESAYSEDPLSKKLASWLYFILFFLSHLMGGRSPSRVYRVEGWL